MGTPFDLHVLSTPPAFILSQDQTLNKMVSAQGLSPEQIIFIELIPQRQRNLDSRPQARCAQDNFLLAPGPEKKLCRTEN